MLKLIQQLLSAIKTLQQRYKIYITISPNLKIRLYN